ncbi:MAG TPA: helix-turn-helix transcriptional regulator [Acidimicrobiales bacterium]|jgi:transcriptional regulator with XRE-family HTH domain|nr:helix-turn-helix transcriptional regulator [Acidimicrobiales bacterium]
MSTHRQRAAVTVELGRRVRKLRTELGMSQEKLAEKAHVHRTYVGSLERGERNVALINIVRLAEALDIDPCELVTGLTSDD